MQCWPINWLARVLFSLKAQSGAASLLAVADKIDVTRMKKPSFMMVLVADGDFAYLRKDGVIVCPIGCLKP